MSYTEIGLVRCEILENIKIEIEQMDSMPEDEQRALIWALNRLLVRYRCVEVKN